ncbi:hypothetical protein PV08_05401 [Exophiala spinifera]|uniref:Ig-like domain-containing protein n=1 Tax=Exophiala spinifera TaxID=91928 RepID=A0A0D2B9P5_9EURO|nr:uncharacterized protein PV08_05401 [Exophiala spinifera]KIW15355.1 hypothetical protein PV08_05401 [Exophiala spinifera]
MFISNLSSAAFVAALLPPVSAFFRYDGKSHNHPNHPRPRQAANHDGGQQNPSSPQVSPIPTSPGGFDAEETLSPQDPGTMSTVALSSVVVVPIYTAANWTGSSYVFPTTVVQVPVATLCRVSAEGPFFTMAPTSNTTVTEINSSSSSSSSSNSNNNMVTDYYLPVQVNATATLPGGRTTVFLSTSSTRIARTMTSTSSSGNGETKKEDREDTGASVADDDMARIILDPSGCQTVYSPLTTQACITTVNPGVGMLPVQVTDCGQWVTFSSERLCGCTSSSPNGAGDYVTAETSIMLLADGEAEATTSASAARVTDPMAFYAAPWYDLVPVTWSSFSSSSSPSSPLPPSSARVPPTVRVENCLPFATGVECVTSSERWSVTSTTRTTTESKVVSFEGLAVITSGTTSTTTTVSLSTTLSLTSVVTDSSIVRSRIAGDVSPDGTETVTIAVSTPTTKTWLVEAVSHMHPQPRTQTARSESRVTDTVSVDPDSTLQGAQGTTTTTVVVRLMMTSTLDVTETKTRSVVPAAPAPEETEARSG